MPRIVEEDRAFADEALRALTAPPHRTRVRIRQLAVEGVRWIEWEGRGIFWRGRHRRRAAGDRPRHHPAHAGGRGAPARRGALCSRGGRVAAHGRPTPPRPRAQDHLSVNDYGSRLRGVSRDAMIGTDVLDWVYPADRGSGPCRFGERARAALSDVARLPGRHRGRDPLVRMGRHDDLSTSTARPPSCNPVGFDVTERRAQPPDALRVSLEELRARAR